MLLLWLVAGSESLTRRRRTLALEPRAVARVVSFLYELASFFILLYYVERNVLAWVVAELRLRFMVGVLVAAGDANVVAPLSFLDPSPRFICVRSAETVFSEGKHQRRVCPLRHVFHFTARRGRHGLFFEPLVGLRVVSTTPSFALS